MKQLKFVIVGHVDHGKSTLIGRLFFDTDSLPADKVAEVEQASRDLGRKTEFAFLLDSLREERDQGITIDTAQTFFKTAKREYVIIDAPGHREFVKNMITGASQAEAAVLIIDASQGVKEQTRRHAYILAMLGIGQVLVVVNKMDLVNFKQEVFDQVKRDIQGFLDSIKIKAKCYIPISAIKGDNIAKKSKNMGWYQGASVLAALDSLENKQPPQNQPLVFPVQDVYRVDDKRISVGRVEAGMIKKGERIKVLPETKTTTVASIEKYLEKTTEAFAGESIGITTKEALFLERGNVVCAAGQELELRDRFYANIFWLNAGEFDKQEKLTLRCATQEVDCKVERIVKRLDSSSLEVIEQDAVKLANLEVGEVIIKTSRPIAVKMFKQLEELGRFVLVKNENTCAGGIITAI